MIFAIDDQIIIVLFLQRKILHPLCDNSIMENAKPHHRKHKEECSLKALFLSVETVFYPPYQEQIITVKSDI